MQGEKSDTTNKGFSIGSSTLFIGLNSGQHPNFVDERGRLNYYGGFQSKVLLFGLPFEFDSRISSERFRSGRSSYFHLSFNPYTQKQQQLGVYSGELSSVKMNELKMQDSIYQLEGQLSYLQLKKQEGFAYLSVQIAEIALNEIKKKGLTKLPSVDSSKYALSNPLTNLPEIDSAQFNPTLFFDNYLQGKFALDSSQISPELLKDLEKYKSLGASLSEKQEALKKKQESLSAIKNQVKELEDATSRLSSFKTGTFLQGIKRFDLGTSTLSAGGLSGNSVPIQGIHASGVYRKAFYDVAVGASIPNQLFSSSIFEQVSQNTATLFNTTGFGQLAQSRFVASTVVGLGNPEERFVSLSSFYTGRTLDSIRNKGGGERTQTENLSFGLGKSNGFYVTGTLGQSFDLNKFSTDTATRLMKDNSTAKLQVSYPFRKLGSKISATSMYLGKSYNGFSQGLYTNGYFQNELTWKQRLGASSSVQLSGIRTEFLPRSVGAKSFLTEGVRLGLEAKLWKGMQVHLGGSLLHSEGNDSLFAGWNPLMNGGYSYTKKIKKNFSLLSSGSGSFIEVLRKDSALRVSNFNAKIGTQLSRIYVGIKVSSQNYTGTARLQGAHWFYYPELILHLQEKNQQLKIKAQGSYSKSVQFGNQYGGKVEILAQPSEYLSWSFLFQKYIENDAIYFLSEKPEFYRGFFAEMKLNIYLNVRK